MGKPPKTGELLQKPKAEVAHCAICGIECCPLEINWVTLCEPHFDAWLKLPRDPSVGGPAAMASFVAKSKRGAA